MSVIVAGMIIVSRYRCLFDNKFLLRSRLLLYDATRCLNIANFYINLTRLWTELKKLSLTISRNLCHLQLLFARLLNFSKICNVIIGTIKMQIYVLEIPIILTNFYSLWNWLKLSHCVTDRSDSYFSRQFSFEPQTEHDAPVTEQWIMYAGWRKDRLSPAALHLPKARFRALFALALVACFSSLLNCFFLLFLLFFFFFWSFTKRYEEKFWRGFRDLEGFKEACFFGVLQDSRVKDWRVNKFL